ncbi:MAG: diguanylate cyclase [Dehalococcoidia bacterium]|nr:diguanylate cyclase [Dehalococcoidia bacterium]
MNMPPALNSFFGAANDGAVMGSVEAPPIMRVIRPATFALWIVLFSAQAVTIVTTGEGGSWLVVLLSTALFAGVHVQFWYEESDQGQKVHRGIERMRGRMYEDESTGLPNSRHFVFELRRQMMRSVRNGRGFSLVLTDLSGFERNKNVEAKLLPMLGKAMRQAAGESDFVAHLEGPVFAAIVVDDRERSTAEKQESMLLAFGSCIPLEKASVVHPVISLTGYEGELEVRDFLRRAQRDLVAARSRGVTARPMPAPRAATSAA